MLRFFSKIRKSLLDEGKAARYTKYAIGEIFLVVIGILIALQINNWNEERKERDKEQELLLQLKDEYLSNLDELDQKIKLRNKVISSAYKLLEYQDNPDKRDVKEIYKHLNQLIVAATYDPIVNDIISSDRIKLLQNKKLKQLLTRWTSDVTYVTEEEQQWLTYRNNHIRPTLNKYTSSRSRFNEFFNSDLMDDFFLGSELDVELDLGQSSRKQDLNALFDDSNIEDHAAIAVFWSRLTNEQSKVLRERILEILDLIEKDLH